MRFEAYTASNKKKCIRFTEKSAESRRTIKDMTIHPRQTLLLCARKTRTCLGTLRPAARCGLGTLRCSTRVKMGALEPRHTCFLSAWCHSARTCCHTPTEKANSPNKYKNETPKPTQKEKKSKFASSTLQRPRRVQRCNEFFSAGGVLTLRSGAGNATCCPPTSSRGLYSSGTRWCMTGLFL